jgi:hypothetical protein
VVTIDELGGGARTLVNAGRDALRPTLHDRARNLQRLRRRLGDFSGIEHVRPASGIVARKPNTQALSWTLGAVALGGVVVTFALSHREYAAAAPTAPRAIASQSASTTAPAPDAPAPNPEPRTAAPSPAEPHSTDTRNADARAAHRPGDGLAEEVAILSRAETELHAGRPAPALALLEEHRQKFPHGALAEERIAARIQALCALGRNSEAEAALSRLQRLSPDSAQATRAREACAANAKH